MEAVWLGDVVNRGEVVEAWLIIGALICFNHDQQTSSW